MGFFDFFFKRSSKKKLAESLASSNLPKRSFWEKFKELFGQRTQLDEELLEQVENLLIGADMGMATSERLIEKLKRYTGKDIDLEKATTIIKEDIIALLNTPIAAEANAELPIEQGKKTPHIILVVGVNGAGKTTSIGKLAHFFAGKKQRVMIGAADTFRAAAVEQIQIWGKRLNVPVVSKGTHKDPGAVAYEAVDEAIKQQVDVLLVDTAGRLHNKVGLMNELAKIKRVINKRSPLAPQEVLLVLDGSTGQNAWQQASIFHETLGVTGLVITKLDGVAKGGVVIGIVAELGIPIRYIGMGEQAEDLVAFDVQDFVNQLFDERSPA